MNKKKNSSSPHAEDCCSYQETDNLKCTKLLPEMCCELRELVNRHNCLLTRRRRIHELAEPLRRHNRYQPKCPCRFQRQINIEREQPIRTRTEQLALTPVRKLLLFKSNFRCHFNKARLEIINRHIRKSLLSLYSLLAKAEPPNPIIPIPTWTKKEWVIHRKYLKKLAKPKVPPQPTPVPKTGMPYGEMERYKELALPKEFIHDPKEDWTLTDGLKFYKASKRIREMATPIKREDDALSAQWPISDAAKTYKASKRIKDLAIARDKRQVQSDIKDNPFSIEPNALKYRATLRIKELAEPKEYDDIHIRQNPTYISPAALKAKPTPRLIELAKPKDRI